ESVAFLIDVEDRVRTQHLFEEAKWRDAIVSDLIHSAQRWRFGSSVCGSDCLRGVWRMARFSINLRDLVILVADPSSYMSMLIHSMLRGFGSNKVLEVRNSMGVFHALTAQRIDLLVCDARLPLQGGLQLTRAIRGRKDNEHRTMPILMMTADSRESTIKQARDAGANMAIAKPLSRA